MKKHAHTETGLSEEDDHDKSCPKIIPLRVAYAAVDIINSFFGPPTPPYPHSPSSQYHYFSFPTLHVRLTSDLALTALFGFGLVLDLWGGSGSGSGNNNNYMVADIVLNAIVRYGSVEYSGQVGAQHM